VTGVKRSGPVVVNDRRSTIDTGNGRRWVSVLDADDNGQIMTVWKGNRALVTVCMERAHADLLSDQLRRK
jgi:hypothetical protein